MAAKEEAAQPIQIPITSEDVGVNFTQEEWKCLTPTQKTLYQTVMSETFKNLSLVARTQQPQEPGAALKDEESADEEEASFVCRGVFKGGPLLFCLTCGKCFKKSAFLLNHQFPSRSQRATSHQPPLGGETPFSCYLCGKTYRDASGLSRHRRAHLGYKPHACPVCGKCFRDQSEVKRHLKVHQNRKPVAGNQMHTVPPTTPGSQAPILRHVKVIQGPVARAKARNGRASCLDVRTKTVVVRHTKVTISCPFCPVTFTKRVCFLAHINLHYKGQSSQESSHASNTPRKPKIYYCPVCDNCFRERESLLEHLCEKRLFKCAEILGHLLGFLPNPLVLQNISQVEGSSGGQMMDKDKKT
ncbi:zinc finger protein 57 homolog [Psammomys obesus]|uniref:zinc finger protein 57 homolog n=1 Tax=Psammomys obesus TaxID=48139 RepID=UPI0024530716|nr:zinc finger protein 57 homolog [Psammomys obesus]